MMFVSHSVIKDQKIIFNVSSTRLSALKRRVRYVIDNRSSTALFKLFFRTIYSTFSALPKHRFLRWSGGQGKSLTHCRQPRFSIIFRTISHSNSANFAARFVVNKAGDSTHKINPSNPFLQKKNLSANTPTKPPFLQRKTGILPVHSAEKKAPNR